MSAFHFIKEYIKHPRDIGAIIPSSKQLAKRMMDAISFQNASCIVEYGAGTGVFTKQLIINRSPHTALLIIERNKQFYEILCRKYGHLNNVYIVHGSAQYIDDYMKQFSISKIDYVVSGLPFTSLPLSISQLILKKTAQLLGTNGTFVTFQYSKMKQSFFQTFFKQIERKKVYWNVPPAYIFTCKNI